MFRFSIRELMFVTFVVGLLIAWWIDKAKISSLQEDIKLLEARSNALVYVLTEEGCEVQVETEGVVVNGPRKKSYAIGYPIRTGRIAKSASQIQSALWTP